ncbi:MAG: hypothetical protein ACF8R7_04105 [Phycisphaerales bacterium JB039]
MRIVWALLFLGLAVLTGWLTFVAPEPSFHPVMDLLFLICVVGFLGAVIAEAVQRLHRTI